MTRSLVAALTFGVALLHAALGAWADELPRKGTLGVRIAAVPDDVRTRETLGRVEGVLVEAVVPGATADRAGITAGDVLLAVNDRKVDGVDDFLKTIGAMTALQRLEIAVVRGGRRTTRSLTLDERPRDRGDNFDVLYHHVVSRGARIRTIVTKPHMPGKHPTVFLIQGLGVATVDRPLRGPEPYSRILHVFSRGGYVTVRVDKPGIGDSEGSPYGDTDFETELDVYRQALLAVKRYDFVDADAVFIFGHSMGGVFGPILAGETPVKGIAVYGTVVRTWTEYCLENWRRQAALEGASAASIDTTVRDLASALQYLLVDGQRPDEIVQARPALRSILNRLLRDGRIDGRAVPFWSQLARTNLPSAWVKGNAHVLAIWGKNEFIASETDHVLIAEIVNKARPGKGRYLALEGIDHGFRKTVSMEDSFTRWKAPDGEFNPRIIATLKDWTESIRNVP